MRANEAGDAAPRSRLQLQCADGQVLDVMHEEAMMSSTLWTLLQDVTDRRRSKRGERPPSRHLLPVADVPSYTVELALDYCRCLYQQQVERSDDPMREWEETFFELDSKTLCDLAKVASNLDIQPLVDLTCRSIAQIMSATEAADELRHKFGLEDAPPAHDATCNCQEMRADVAAGFDFDVLNALDHDISTEEYEFVELEQPSVDELLDFINGDADHPAGSGKPGSKQKKKGGSVDTASDAGNDGSTPGSAGKKKKKAKKKKKKKAATAHTATSAVLSQPSAQDEEDEDEDDARADEDARDEDSTSDEDARAAELSEKMRLARLNPSAVFLESQFEDDSDEEMDEQLESFRLALESAYVDSRKTAAHRPRLVFAPQDVFRSTGGRASQCLASTVGSS